MPRVASKKNLLSTDEIADQYPLHMLVWCNNAEALNEKLAENKVICLTYLQFRNYHHEIPCEK